MRLSFNKLVRAKNIVKRLLNRITILYLKLELIVNFLSFTIKIVILEKVFLRRIFDALRRSIIIIRITSEIRANLL